ncbi:hypothetical protein AAZQ98_11110 [Glutamicibacter sp. Je.9.36]
MHISAEGRRNMVVMRCEHGYHHHAGPHACDWGNHGEECPYWASRKQDAANQ